LVGGGVGVEGQVWRDRGGAVRGVSRGRRSEAAGAWRSDGIGGRPGESRTCRSGMTMARGCGVECWRWGWGIGVGSGGPASRSGRRGQPTGTRGGRAARSGKLPSCVQVRLLVHEDSRTWHRHARSGLLELFSRAEGATPPKGGGALPFRKCRTGFSKVQDGSGWRPSREARSRHRVTSGGRARVWPRCVRSAAELELVP
jgi:hypothetical protein